MKTEGIHRVVLAVRDIDEARKRYTELLGIEFRDLGVQEQLGVHIMINWESQFEIMSPTDTNRREGKSLARFLEKRDEGVYLICFNVGDAEAAAKMAEEKGIRITARVEGTMDDRFRVKEVVLHPKDTGGPMIMMVQSSPVSSAG